MITWVITEFIIWISTECIQFFGHGVPMIRRKDIKEYPFWDGADLDHDDQIYSAWSSINLRGT